MYIKCILLSLCLIVRITNIKSLFIPPVAIAKTAKGYVNAIGILGTYMAVSDQIEDKAGEVNKYVEQFQVFAKDLAYGLQHQMRLVEIEVKYSAAAILTEFKMLSLQSAVVQIDTNLALLTFKVKQFEANKTTIVEFLSGFIDMHQSLKLDLAVIDKLDASSAAQPKTLMAVFVEYFRMLQTYKQTKLRQTTRKFIDEFYLSVMMAVEKHHNLILLAYNLHAYYGGENIGKDGEYYVGKKEMMIKKLLLSWKRAINMAYDPDDYTIFINLKNNVEDVRFKNLLQTHFATEMQLKGQCSGSCKDVERLTPYNDKYCQGSIYKCYDLLDFYQVGTVVYSSHSERIYQRYSVDSTWYGISGAAFTKQRVKMDQRRFTNDHKYICEQCRCTCDQSLRKNTVRSFYAGKMKPNRPEDVITGVRFADRNKTIYLEIEVGQLLPLGLINASTVHWQGPPDDLVSNVLKFSANIFTFHLDKIHIKKGFLSGIQIFEVNKEWRLRIFSKMFENFAQGIVSDKEETHVDPDKHTYYFLNDKNVLVSKRPGRTTMNFDYKIGFGTSNQDTDAGQSIVPYFDATDIFFDVRAPLGGVGFVHHSSSSDYAGYIRPIIYSMILNYTEIFDLDGYE